MRDPLTGARSRVEWPPLAEAAASWAAKPDRGAWVALIDIDNFKRFNMHNGHIAGDQVLVNLARFLLSLERGEDVTVIRTGGQEFVLLSREEANPDVASARHTCQRILQWARESLTPPQETHCGRPDCVGPTRLTLSIALGSIQPGERPASLRQRLETILLEAKSAGRDRIASG
jgi:diguanylate cyclase (GGDEF)-like protein